MALVLSAACALHRAPIAPRAIAVPRTRPILAAAVTDYRPAAPTAGSPEKAIIFYRAYAAGFTVLLLRTLRAHPLVPPNPSSLAWNAAWLWTTVVDYYGAALCLVGIILASEKRRPGVLWSLGCLLLGTPFCCFYVCSRLLRTGTLRLSDS